LSLGRGSLVNISSVNLPRTKMLNLIEVKDNG